MSVEGVLEAVLRSKGPDRPEALKGRRQVREDGTASCTTRRHVREKQQNGKIKPNRFETPTGGFKALDVSGGLQEVAAQEEEQSEERHNRDEDPWDDGRCHGDHTENLQEHLKITAKVFTPKRQC